MIKTTACTSLLQQTTEEIPDEKGCQAASQYDTKKDQSANFQ